MSTPAPTAEAQAAIAALDQEKLRRLVAGLPLQTDAERAAVLDKFMLPKPKE